MKNKMGGNNQRLAIMLGMLTKDKQNPVKVNIPSEDKSQFSQEKYKFLLEAKFDISNRCCSVMKKEPLIDTIKKPIENLLSQLWHQRANLGHRSGYRMVVMDLI